MRSAAKLKIFANSLLIATLAIGPALAQNSKNRPSRNFHNSATKKETTLKPEVEKTLDKTGENIDWEEKFKSDNEEERFNALNHLVLESTKRAEYLQRGLNDKDWMIRGRAAQLVANLSVDERAPFIKTLLEKAVHEFWFVQGSALLGIADLLEQREAKETAIIPTALNLAIELRLDREAMVRRQAVRVIAATQQAGIKSYILPMLTDENIGIRWEAAIALAKLGDRGSIPALIAAKRLAPETARTYGAALYLFGEQESFNDLLAAIDEADGTFTRFLMKSLCHSGDPRSLQPLQALLVKINERHINDLDLRLSIVDALAHLQNPLATPTLLELVQDEERAMQLAAIKGLSTINDKKAIIPMIELLLRAPDREYGDALIDTIATYQTVETVDLLFKYRQDKEGKIRPAIDILLNKMGISVDRLSEIIKTGKPPAWQRPRDAARWLSALGVHSSFEPLVAALNNKETEVRAEAAKALSGMGDRSAIEPLLLLLEDNSESVREAAIGSLKELGITPESLQQRLQSAEWRVKADAASLAGRMRLKELVPALINVGRDREIEVRVETVNALAKLKDNRAVDLLVSSLDDESGRVRAGAVIALGNIGDDRAAVPLVRTLGSYDVALSAIAADALIKLKSSAATAELIKTLKARNWRARAQASRVLGQTKELSAIVPLIPLLSDRAAPVRYYACQALTNFGEAAIPALIDAIKKNDQEAYQYGPARVLALIGKPAVVATCALLNEQDANIRVIASSVLAEIGDDQAVGPLMLLLDDDRFVVRQMGAFALGQTGKMALDPLLEALKAKKLPKKRTAAAIALKFLGERDAVPALLEALSDKDDQVRAAAAEALAVVGDIAVVAQLETIASSDRADIVKTAARAAINQIQARK